MVGDAIAVPTHLPPRSKNVYRRERWGSRAAFYFAAIGAAVGFGNIWRFPSLVYSYGGGAFLIPYILALIFIGLPVLILEVALGQYYESGNVEVFGGIHRRLRGVGLGSIACGFMGVTYYSMLIAWVIHAFFDSFGKNSFWAGEDLTGDEALTYFFEDITGTATVGDDLKPTRLVWANVGYSLIVWAIIFLCVTFGVKVTGQITYFTVGAPILLLFVFLVRSLTLEGASMGVSQYLSTDWSVLSDRPDIWVKATGQIFFSLSIAFGAMTAYASHCPRDEPAVRNSVVIALSNSLFSFVSGFAVFAILGYLATIEGKDIADLTVGGFGLVFGSFPVALSTLPGAQHWIRFFFLMLFLLGIDSAFSFMEASLVSFNDSKQFTNINPKKLALVVATAGWLFSWIYATDAGLYLSDVMDYYINFVMFLVGAFECFSAGWIYNIEEQVDSLGSPIVFSFMATYFGSFFVACIAWFASDPSVAMWAGFVALLSSLSVGLAFVALLMRHEMKKGSMWSWRSAWFDLALRNVFELRDDLAIVVGRIPLVWALLVKFFIPPVLLVLFSMGCAATTDDGKTEFGNYGGYPPTFQVLGIMAVFFIGFLFFSAAIMPRLYTGFTKTNSPVPNKKDDTDLLARARAGQVANIAVMSSTTTTNTKTEGELSSSAESDVETPKMATWPPTEEKA